MPINKVYILTLVKVFFSGNTDKKNTLSIVFYAIQLDSRPRFWTIMDTNRMDL